MNNELLGVKPEDVIPEDAIPSKEEQQKIVDEVVELANKSNAFFGTENERKKDDFRVYSDVEIFSASEKKALGEDRGLSSVNPLPLYKNAIANLFLQNPFVIDAECENDNVIENPDGTTFSAKEFVNDVLQKTLDNSDANTSVFGAGLGDITLCGDSFMYLTTDNGEIDVNIAYDPTSVIYDPNAKKVDGRDAEYFGLVESISYEKAKELTGGNIPAKERLEKCKTYSFGGFKGTPGSVNLLHFFKKVEGGVMFYQIVADIVIKAVEFKGLSCLPVVPIFGQEFKDDNKKLYKGSIRDVKHLCKIINGCYTKLWERVQQCQDPYQLIDMNGCEGYTDDYNSDSVKYKRWRSRKKVGPNPADIIEASKPELVTPQITTGDIIPVINDSLVKISKMIGVPEEGIGFSAAAATSETATAVLTRSNALVTNVSHYYRHLQQSVKHLCEVIVEMVCIYNGLENNFTIKLSKGPEDALRKERLRQQMTALLGITPDAAKPLVTAEIVKTFDIENGDAIASAILLTLPAEMRAALNGGQDPATLQQQLAQAQQLNAELQAQNEEMQKQIQSDAISVQGQLVMARESNEAALRSKLIELEAKAAENEKDRALEYAKLDASQQEAFLDAANKSKEADIHARDMALKELEVAQKLRQEAEAKRAELVAKVAKAMPAPVEVQPVVVQ